MAEEAKNGKKDNIWHKYKRLIISITSIFVVGYVVIYILFANGFILDPGAELKKKDWLAFSSGYLSFAASLIVGGVAISQSRLSIRQNHFFGEEERKRHVRNIQPILSVNLIMDTASKSIFENGCNIQTIEIKSFL